MPDKNGSKIFSPEVLLGLFDELPQSPNFMIDFLSHTRVPLTVVHDRDPALEYVPWQNVRAKHLHRAAALLIPCHVARYSNPADCILVGLLEDFQDDFIHCNFVCSFQVCESPAIFKLGETAHDSQVIIKAIWLPYPQTWIVD